MRTPEDEARVAALRRDPEAELYSAEGALIDGADVPQSPRDSARRRLLAVADTWAIVGAYLLMWLIVPPEGTITERLGLLGAVPLWLLMHKLLGLYDRDDKLIHKSTLDEFPKLLHAVSMAAVAVLLVGPLVLPFEIQRTQTGVFSLLALAMLGTGRAAARSWVRHRLPPERCLIVGTGAVAQSVARKLVTHPEYGVELVGFVDSERVNRRRNENLPIVGDLERFAEVCREHDVERAIIAFSAASYEETLAIVRTAKRARIKITIVPRLYEVIGHTVEVDELEGMTVLSLRGLSRSGSSLKLKRAIDVTGALAGLMVLAPVMAGIALAVKLTSRGPVLYRQRRIGRDREFQMLKFRSMVVDADALKPTLEHLNEAEGPMFKIADDPRVTRVGRWLRRTSMDELPQLVNVLRGEMSLVGPRPLVPDEDDHVIGWHRARLELTPGLTGPWQVAGRTAIPFEEMVKMDYLYVAEWSLWSDIRLLLRTAPVVLFARGH